ncbi:MAG: hypothetical protein EI684_20650 [Candidatus Viridilinea halotolerans]|uniref:DM13 domain-containing protein n=1 Tax=Candidatus Viridilinea halotolerans TaxID=2491704 RepID=A0A426TRX0_9CHLR|nr:MAG: hypothetical protein EI684_20650 [Candidatus Viridilinea halotolerans]
MFTRLQHSWAGLNWMGRSLVLVGMGLGLVMVVWLAGPLFYDVTVDEEFPVALSTSPAVLATAVPTPNPAAPPASATEGASGGASVPTATAPAESLGGVATLEAVAVPAAPEADPATATPSGPIALSSGAFTQVSDRYSGEGTATIYQGADGQLLLRFEDFAVTNAPDLVVGLSGHPAPRSSAETYDQGYVQLDSLRGNRGNQNYVLPAGFDLTDYRSVVIYCRAFSVVVSTAELRGLER